MESDEIRLDPVEPTEDQCCYTLCTSLECFKKIAATRWFKRTKLVLLIIYALNIVAWGGMLFLILVGAANNTMPNEQTRKTWIEIDSQILNALFCVPGLGLFPCRVRDLYELLRKKYRGALSRRHKYATSFLWVRVVVWSAFANSLFQIGLAICMWSMDMDTRPAWLVGLFVGFGCLTGVVEGLTKAISARRKKRNASDPNAYLE